MRCLTSGPRSTSSVLKIDACCDRDSPAFVVENVLRMAAVLSFQSGEVSGCLEVHFCCSTFFAVDLGHGIAQLTPRSGSPKQSMSGVNTFMMGHADLPVCIPRKRGHGVSLWNNP